MILLTLFATTVVTSAVFCYKFDVYSIVCNTCERKYRKWKTINDLVSSKYENLYDVYMVSIEMILKSVYLSFIQYLNNSVTKLDKNTYQVEYVIGGKLYKMIVIPKKGPSPVIQIRNHENKDITDFILQYYGPNYDWHSVRFIPQFFHCRSMTFEMDDGTEKVFEELDYIKF